MTIGFPFCCGRFLDSLIPALVSYLPKMSSFELLKVVYHLCLLGHFPSALLEPLLQSSTLEKFKSTGKTNTIFVFPPHLGPFWS